MAFFVTKTSTGTLITKLSRQVYGRTASLSHAAASIPSDRRTASTAWGREKDDVSNSRQQQWSRSSLSRREIAQKYAEERDGPLSKDAQALRASLDRKQADPFRALEDHIARGTASVDIVRTCLLAAKTAVFTSRQREAEAAERAPGFAATILKYAWKHDDVWYPLATGSPDAQFALCYFAVLEGLDDYIIEWIGVHAPAPLVKPAMMDRQERWRNELFRALIAATIVLDNHTETDQIDRALTHFLDVFNKKQQLHQQFRSHIMHAKDLRRARGRSSPDFIKVQQKIPPLCSVSLRPAAFELCSALTCERYSTPSVSLFEQFISAWSYVLRDEKRSPDSVAWDVPFLSLCHPTMADARGAIDFLREQPGIEQSVDGYPKQSQALAKFMRKTFEVAQATSRAQDAAWVKRRFEEAFGRSIKQTERASRHRMGSQPAIVRRVPQSQRR